MDYAKISLILKAMAEPNRMKIIHLLSTGDLCACEVLQYFDFTQPTLSHHMKVLEKAGIVSVRKKGQWHYYGLKEDFSQNFMHSMTLLLSNDQKNISYSCEQQNCVCTSDSTL